jgi:preprotein translocase subunit SecA
MINKLKKKIKGIFDPNQQLLNEAKETVKEINNSEKEVKKLSTKELKETTSKFQNKIGKISEVDNELPQELKAILPQVYAHVREASRRVADHRQFDVQLIGGYFLAHNMVTEMFTGEGKTVAAHLPAYLYGLAGKGVHVVTVNDYLAKRDAEWTGHIMHALGMTVSVVTSDKAYKFIPDEEALENDENGSVKELIRDRDLSNMSTLRGANLKEVSKKEAYLCDITYGTSSEFGFDYLRDNMVQYLDQKVQRDHYFTIVDECDSILIDEARTPLIISSKAAKANQLYLKFAQISKRLEEEEDYTVDEKDRSVFLTQQGIKRVENMLNTENLWENFDYAHHLENALKAKALFTRDVDYIVKNNEVFIVDNFTGRVLPGRRYSEGLHQAIEAKEGVEIKKESKTMATISYQNYFRKYNHLAGMTGTALTEAEEFKDIYNLDTVAVPTYKPIVRKDYADIIYKTQEAKFNAVTNKIIELNKKDQPVLVGTNSIDKSEYLSELLTKEGVPHEVLNAKHHEKEAQIVAKAGQKGAVTVATNMAGRGTDIKLDEETKDLGGLFVIGTQRHEARRIDNQLRGRSGRLGDPGASLFFVSLEDELMRRFGGETMKQMFNTLQIEENVPIEANMIARAIKSAQKKVENVNFEIRKHLVEYDDVLNNHREIIYSLRDKVLNKLQNGKSAKVYNQKNLKPEDYLNQIDYESTQNFIENYSLLDKESWGNKLFSKEKLFDAIKYWILQKFLGTINRFFSSSLSADSKIDTQEIKQVSKNVFSLIPPNLLEESLKDLGISSKESFTDKILSTETLEEKQMLFYKLIIAAFVNYYKNLKPQIAEQVERGVILSTIDQLWTEHLDAMRVLREGINLRSYAQKDPLIEYKNEGYRLFDNMIKEVGENISERLFKVKSIRVPKEMKNDLLIQSAQQALNKQDNKQKNRKQQKKEPITNTHNVGRNDPCPCGSGKKYKKCCFPKYE